jgi:diguanylate cyclase (GGDEF)-like protein
MTLLRRLPGQSSYRGRYLYFIALAMVVFSLFSYSSWKQITEASLVTQENILKRSKNTATLNTIINHIPAIKVQIYQFSLDPQLHSEVETSHSITEFIELISELDIMAFDDIDPIELNNFIIQIPIKLHDAMIDLISIRNNTDLWIPSTRIMAEQLLPLNNEIQETLNAMLADAEYPDNNNTELQNAVLQIKVTWISIVSEFRLIVANRFGFFGTSSRGVDSRLQNLEILLPLLQQQLDTLEPVIANDDYTFIHEVFYPQLVKNITQWSKIHGEAIELIKQKNWRKDIEILNHIEGLLESFSSTFIDLRNELNQQSVRDIQKLSEISHSLSLFVIMMSLLTLILLILGYLILDRHILRPIARTTRALLMQSQGVSHELNLKSSASETRNLIEAFNQMSEQIRHRELHLDFMAHHDALTKLPNRLLFNERLEHALKLTGRSDKSLAMMLLDLDRFKMINDTLGHLFGDKLLQETADRLKQCLRTEDTIARLGGDEFAIIIENITSTNEVEVFSKKIIELFKQPFYIDEQEVHISTSIGIAMAPLHSTQPTTLTRFADIAMYQSKHLGGNQFTWFVDDLVNAEQSMIKFENQLREAITGNQFEIHYQPLINTQDRRYISCEALLRWRHPERGLMHPAEFIGILENSEILYDLTCWLIRETQNFQQQIAQQFSINPTISINLPSIIFQQKNYREKIYEQLSSQINAAENCVIEVTEDTLISDIKNTSLCLNKLHNQGFKIALDDFGTGQSSLSHLRAFPIDIIKIDKEFIRNVHCDTNDANLVSAIISMGHDLGLRVIAEGVEQRQQLDFLNQRHCHFIQGFYFSRPLPADEYRHFVAQQLQQS